MNRNRRFSKGVGILSAGLALCMLLEPLQVVAAENNSVLQVAGVSSVLETSLTVEEYIAAAEQAKGAMWGYTNLGIANVESGNLNIRETPSTSGKLVGKLPKNAACEVLGIEGEWAHIKSGEVEGYVSLEFLVTGPDAKLLAEVLVRTVAVANTDKLNVRAEANTESDVYTQVLKGEELEYIETMGDWVKVSLDGEEAYVAA